MSLSRDGWSGRVGVQGDAAVAVAVAVAVS
jgi:hypothetical protein